jgi:hypothetical protein
MGTLSEEVLQKVSPSVKELLTFQNLMKFDSLSTHALTCRMIDTGKRGHSYVQLMIMMYDVGLMINS